MKTLAELLRNHPVPGIKEAEIRRACAEVITRVTGVTVGPKQISFTDGSLSLSVPPVLKSALVLKFSEAQEALQKEGVTLREIR